MKPPEVYTSTRGRHTNQSRQSTPISAARMVSMRD